MVRSGPAGRTLRLPFKTVSSMTRNCARSMASSCTKCTFGLRRPCKPFSDVAWLERNRVSRVYVRVIISSRLSILPTGGNGKHKRFATIVAQLTEEAPTSFREVAISRDARGNYFVSFVSQQPEQSFTDTGVVAFDLGIKTLATGVNEQGRVYTIGGFKGARWYNKQL